MTNSLFTTAQVTELAGLASGSNLIVIHGLNDSGKTLIARKLCEHGAVFYDKGVVSSVSQDEHADLATLKTEADGSTLVLVAPLNDTLEADLSVVSGYTTVTALGVTADGGVQYAFNK